MEKKWVSLHKFPWNRIFLPPTPPPPDTHTNHIPLFPLPRTYRYARPLGFPSLPQTARVEGRLPLTLTLSLSLLGHHIAADTEVQPLQSWLQPYTGSIPQSVVHSKGPHEDSDN